MKKTIFIIAPILLLAAGFYYFSIPPQETPEINQESSPQGLGGGGQGKEGRSSGSEELVDKNPTSAEKSIRDFMGDPNLALQYIGYERNASNFNVMKKVAGEGQYITPVEWQRPVYVFRQTKYINNLCEVYSYEVDADTYEIIQISVVYPPEIQPLSPDDLKVKCVGYPSFDYPVKTKDELWAIANQYLSRVPSITDFISDPANTASFTPTKLGVPYPSSSEWKWADNSYEIPSGLTSDPDTYPKVQIRMSVSGKLISYFNSSKLFPPKR